MPVSQVASRSGTSSPNLTLGTTFSQSRQTVAKEPRDPVFVAKDTNAFAQADGFLDTNERLITTPGTPQQISRYLGQQADQGVKVFSLGSNHHFEPLKTEALTVRELQNKGKKVTCALEIPAQTFWRTQALVTLYNKKPNATSEPERVKALTEALRADLSAYRSAQNQPVSDVDLQTYANNYAWLMNEVYKCKADIALIDAPYDLVPDARGGVAAVSAYDRDWVMARAIRRRARKKNHVVVACMGRFHAHVAVGPALRQLGGDVASRKSSAGMHLEQWYGEKHLSVSFFPSMTMLQAHPSPYAQSSDLATYDFGAWEKNIFVQE